MKVSIVTISYNQARYIEETIHSVLSQDYNDIEYIVIDAGSTDNSRDLILKYSDRIDQIIFEPDNGPADGLNKGFSRASGDIYYFLNSDDLLLDNSISKIIDVYKSNPSTDVVYGNAFKIDRDGKKIGAIISDIFSPKKYLLGVCTFAQPSIFFKSEAFNEIKGFNKKNMICWDGELFLNLSLRKKSFLKFNGYLSSFRVYNDSISQSEQYISKYKAEQERIFQETMKRNRNMFDKIHKSIILFAKQIENPNKGLQRLKKTWKRE